MHRKKQAHGWPRDPTTILLLGFFLGCMTLAMAIIYVTTSGSDTAGDGSAAMPYRTVNKAIQSASAGDTVSVGTGTYAETVTINKALTLQPTSGNQGDAILTSAGSTLSIAPSTNNVTVSKMHIISTATTTAAVAVNRETNSNDPEFQRFAPMSPCTVVP